MERHEVAQKVQEYIRDRHPGGIDLSVIEPEIEQIDYWWRVPVRPSAWPEKRYEYYEALADIEGELQEKENLNILIATAAPLEATPA